MGSQLDKRRGGCRARSTVITPAMKFNPFASVAAMTVALVGLLPIGPVKADIQLLKNGVLVTTVGNETFDGLNVGDSGFTGSLFIDGGSVLTIEKVSSNGVLIVGFGNNGSGFVSIEGASSKIEDGTGTFGSTLEVGVSGQIDGSETAHGAVVIMDGAIIEAPVKIGLGKWANDSGVITVSGAGSELRQVGATDRFGGASPGAPFMQVGDNGTGALNVLAGGRVLLDPECITVGCVSFSAGINVARKPGSHGSIMVSGVDFMIEIAGPASGISIGRQGTGSMSIRLGGSVIVLDIVDGAAQIGREAGSTGVVHVGDPSGSGAATSTFDAGSILRVGLDKDDTDGGIGTLVIDAPVR